jgi:hypothetical protein
MQSCLKLAQAYKDPIDIQGTNATSKMPMRSNVAGDRLKSFIRMHSVDSQAASSPTPKSGSNRLTAIARRKLGEVKQPIQSKSTGDTYFVGG